MTKLRLIKSVPPPLGKRLTFLTPTDLSGVAWQLYSTRIMPEQPLTWWNDDYYAYQGTHWDVVHEAAIEKVAWETFAVADYLKPAAEGAEPERVPWHPDVKKVNGVMRVLSRSVLNEGREPAEDVIAMRNGFLDLQTRAVTPSTPEVFNLGFLPYEYDATAKCPTWVEFLKQSLGGRDDDISLLQEWMGYVVSGRNNMQKIMSLHGEAGAGKGTILRVLNALVGQDNVTAGRMDDIVGPFGMEPLVGKRVLQFGDITWNNTNVQATLQRIHEVSGSDWQTIPRKNRQPWEGRLPICIVIAGNKAPKFKDTSGSMRRRLLMIHFDQSFAGREDWDLTDKLIGELSGILNWALEGLDRLMERGKYELSERAVGLLDAVAVRADPVAAFLEDVLEVVDGVKTSEADVYQAYVIWAKSGGRRDIMDNDSLREELINRLGEKVLNNATTRVNGYDATGKRGKQRAWLNLDVIPQGPTLEF